MFNCATDCLVCSVITVRRRRCTTAAGTPRTAPSSVSRSTGTPTTNEPAAGRDEQAPPPPPPDPTQHAIGSLLLSVSVFNKHTHTHTHTHTSLLLLFLPSWKLCGPDVFCVKRAICSPLFFSFYFYNLMYPFYWFFSIFCLFFSLWIVNRLLESVAQMQSYGMILCRYLSDFFCFVFILLLKCLLWARVRECVI